MRHCGRWPVRLGMLVCIVITLTCGAACERQIADESRALEDELRRAAAVPAPPEFPQTGGIYSLDFARDYVERIGRQVESLTHAESEVSQELILCYRRIAPAMAQATAALDRGEALGAVTAAGQALAESAAVAGFLELESLGVEEFVRRYRPQASSLHSEAERIQETLKAWDRSEQSPARYLVLPMMELYSDGMLSILRQADQFLEQGNPRYLYAVPSNIAATRNKLETLAYFQGRYEALSETPTLGRPVADRAREALEEPARGSLPLPEKEDVDTTIHGGRWLVDGANQVRHGRNLAAEGLTALGLAEYWAGRAKLQTAPWLESVPATSPPSGGCEVDVVEMRRYICRELIDTAQRFEDLAAEGIDLPSFRNTLGQASANLRNSREWLLEELDRFAGQPGALPSVEKELAIQQAFILERIQYCRLALDWAAAVWAEAK